MNVKHQDKINLYNLYPLLTVIVLIIVYIPSLFHLPRGDHWNILMHTLGTSDLAEMIKKSYSYARQSLIAPGDVVLFRPAQSTWLAIEKYLFGSSSMWPQILSFFLHVSIFILLNYLLFLWFNLIDKGNKGLQNAKGATRFLLPLITAFFILNFSIVELAIWASLKGYLFFFALLLIGLIFCTKLISQPVNFKLKYLLYAWIAFLINAFTYEFGQFVCLIVGFIVGAFLFRSGNKKGGLLLLASFASIFFIYRAINSFDYNLHLKNISYMKEFGIPTGETTYSYGNMVKSFFSIPTAKNLWHILSYTIFTPFFPLTTHIHAAGKVYIVKPDLLHFSYLAIPSYLLIFLWCYFLISGVIKAFKNNNVYFKYLFILVSLIYGAYLSIAVLGRMNLRPDYSELAQYSYYNYMGFGFFMILSALAIYYNFQNVSKFNTIKKSIFYSFIAFVFVVTIMSTLIVFKINKSVLQYQSYLRNITGQIEGFIANHQTDKKLRISFDIKNSDYTPMVAGAGIPSVYLFFYNMIDSRNPDYIFIIKDRKVNFYTRAEYYKQYGKNRYLELKIAKVVSPYKIYEYDNIYYGVPHWYLTYDPLTDKGGFIIKDRNIANIIKNIPVKMKELNKKIESGALMPPFDYGMHLIEKDYRGFNITKHFYWYFATPKEYGDLSIESIDRNLYKKWFSSTSLDSLYRDINVSVSRTGS